MTAYPRIIRFYLIIGVIPFLLFGCLKNRVTAKDIMLFDFESDSDLNRFAWKCRTRFELSSEQKNTGSQSLRFEFHPSSRVGFSTGDVPKNWSSYKCFDLWVFNPSADAVSIYFQVNGYDSSGEFIRLVTRSLQIEGGENNISIPLAGPKAISREIEALQKIGGFFIYMQNISTIRVLYFDSFKLVEGAG